MNKYLCCLMKSIIYYFTDSCSLAVPSLAWIPARSSLLTFPAGATLLATGSIPRAALISAGTELLFLLASWRMTVVHSTTGTSSPASTTPPSFFKGIISFGTNDFQLSVNHLGFSCSQLFHPAPTHASTSPPIGAQRDSLFANASAFITSAPSRKFLLVI